MRRFVLQKRLISIFLFVLVLCSSVCFATPDTVSPYETETVTDLIAVTKPEGQKDSTFDNTYVISGYGKEGTVVTLYWHDAANDMYNKILNTVEYTEEDGTVTTAYEEATVTIGASGLFMNTFSPAEGDNNILVRAEKDGEVQYVKYTITRYKRNIFGIIKALAD